jgi:hypothetical protein
VPNPLQFRYKTVTNSLHRSEQKQEGSRGEVPSSPGKGNDNAKQKKQFDDNCFFENKSANVNVNENVNEKREEGAKAPRFSLSEELHPASSFLPSLFSKQGRAALSKVFYSKTDT